MQVAGGATVNATASVEAVHPVAAAAVLCEASLEQELQFYLGDAYSIGDLDIDPLRLDS